MSSYKLESNFTGSGENIWDISSWATDIHWKDAHLHHHFDQLSFTECVQQIVDLSDTYFTNVYERYTHGEDQGEELEFPYLDILVLMTEEYLCGQFFHGVTPLQELQLLEILCRYYQENKLDPVRYFVFDCLFGLPSENLELQQSLFDHKLTIICKLTSIAIGGACGNVLNCIAVWMHTYGSEEGRAAKIASTVVNDYCFICPKAMGAVRDLINVSPVFAYQFIIALCEYYKEKPPEKESGGSDRLPPAMFVDVIAEWIIEQPNFCMLNIPRVFLELPSVHKFTSSSRRALFRSCPLLSFLEWTLVHPLLHEKSNNKSNQCSADGNSYNSDDDCVAYSKLHYGFLNYLSLQRKKEIPKDELSDDLEAGEILEEDEGDELLHKSDIMYLLNLTKKMMTLHCNATMASKEESVNRLIQVLQVAKWAKCTAITLKLIKPVLGELPRTKLVEDFLFANR